MEEEHAHVHSQVVKVVCELLIQVFGLIIRSSCFAFEDNSDWFAIINTPIEVNNVPTAFESVSNLVEMYRDYETETDNDSEELYGPPRYGELHFALF